MDRVGAGRLIRGPGGVHRPAPVVGQPHRCGGGRGLGGPVAGDRRRGRGIAAGSADFASDYSRYLPARTRWTAIALAAAAGQFVAASLCRVHRRPVRAGLAWRPGADPVSQLGAVLPPWYLVPFFIAVIVGGVFGRCTQRLPAALGMMALRVPINRVSSLLFIAAFTLVVRVLTVWYGNFYDVYQQFLALLVYWTAPWAAIIITDHFLRRGQYAPRDLMTWAGAATGTAMACTCRGSLPSPLASPPRGLRKSETFTSPLAMRFFGGADLALEAGLLVPAVLYYVLRRRGMRGGGAKRPRFVRECPRSDCGARNRMPPIPRGASRSAGLCHSVPRRACPGRPCAVRRTPAAGAPAAAGSELAAGVSIAWAKTQELASLREAGVEEFGLHPVAEIALDRAIG